MKIVKLFLLLIHRSLGGLRKGSTLLDKIKGAFCLPFISFFGPCTFKSAIGKKEYTLFFRNGSDVAMWLEVFCDNEYALPKDIDPKKIIDLGANVGFSSLYFAGQYPTADIIAIEPDPYNYQVLLKNTQQSTQINPKPYAIAAVAEERIFYAMPQQGMSSSFIQDAKAEAIKVSSISIEELLKECAWDTVDLIKFDIEGAEWEVFNTAPFDKIQALIGEYHEDIVGRPVQEFIDIFPSMYKITTREIFPQRYLVYIYKI